MERHESSGANESNIVDQAVAEGGAYEVIRKRLIEQGRQLEDSAKQLNESRLNEFGNSDMSVVARVRVRTENNCIARDIVQVGDLSLFGYNVFIGLKKETKLDDVFALFKVVKSEAEYSMEPVPLEGSFLSESSFISDFEELYRYYKHTRLIQLTVKNGKLLAGFQIGDRLEDVRVFRWSVSPDGNDIRYLDNRGERDLQLPPAYDFEWLEATREDIVHGKHAHVNILDTIFIDTLGGDLTIKVEDNTEDGLGIFREGVEDKTQSLDDAEIHYAEVGGLILLKVLPYREETWRYFIFNTMTQGVQRVDAIGQSCVQLPEDHGIIFPGGYYLQSGEYKTFDEEHEGLVFKRVIKSPNGEDVLFVFYEPVEGVAGLFAYNLIEKQLQNPIYGHGYAIAEDGTIIIFSAEGEPTRVHPMQIWQTPYVSAEFASKAPASQTFFGRIGNSELVRGVSDLYSICRMIDNQGVSVRLYEELSKASSKIFDAHYWIDANELQERIPNLGAVLREIAKTSELVIDEFEKVESIRQQSAKTMREAEEEQKEILRQIRPENWETAEDYVSALGRVRRQRGHLTTIRAQRYIDLTRIDSLDEALQEAAEDLSQKTVNFLSGEDALSPYLTKIDKLNEDVATAETNHLLEPIIEEIESTASGLDLLSELMGTLKVDDATLRTRIIDSISEVYAKLNQSKANAKHKQKGLGSEEAVAQFGAQFKLFSQSIANALGLATTPERCDEQLSRLLVQLEELESQFSEFDEFLADIMEKREEIYESFESHKQQLLDERQRKAQSISDAAGRILKSIEKRSLKFTEADDLNTYFASDSLVMKVRELVEQLRNLESAVKADDVEAKFKSLKEQALRALRDKTDIYEDGGNVIKLGPRHKFSVNTQELDLTIIPRDGDLYTHLTGTDYFEKLDLDELIALREFWDMSLESETPEVYRAEYLASLILDSAEQGGSDLSMNDLYSKQKDRDALLKVVREFSSPRYKEGYEKGVHDHDAALILESLLPALQSADLLKFDPISRGLAQIFWANIKHSKTPSRSSLNNENNFVVGFDTWVSRAQSAAQMQAVFSTSDAVNLLAKEIEGAIQSFITCHSLPVSSLNISQAAKYLVAEFGRERTEFITSKYAVELVEELKRSLDDVSWRRYQSALKKMLGAPSERWDLSYTWLKALTDSKGLDKLAHYIPEAIAIINAEDRLERRFTEVDLELNVENLLGDHVSISNQSLGFSLDSFISRMSKHKHEVLPKYHQYHKVRQDIVSSEREALRLEEFKPKPLSSFVRNRLINEAYLPIIGDNLAKQMGTLGENKRSDLMGLLMMISPPGYGKTTLMEYVASRLGLIFMKINCPSLGHDVMSLDPLTAPNATAKQELEKLNLALEMGNNVMLYLDDIQHTHPEFLQKFISLCDGTRRVEGVWKGRTKTYDMRSKKFCVVMAGNPYTESGEAFKVPDMLANRADIYNLGDILGGMEEPFALSYIENSMTSNPVLAPLALREMGDVYKLIDMAKGKNVATTDLSHQYSGAEINEITEVLKKMFVVQDVVLKINQQYIASAAQDDKYRNEPSFKLQGSYRNMNKMTEKISSVMNDDELLQMIADHYVGEAQMLTSGAEGNLLKLAELRGNMTDEQSSRWTQIKKDFLRNKAMGGDHADVGGKVLVQLTDLVENVSSLGKIIEHSASSKNVDANPSADYSEQLKTIAAVIAKLSKGLSANQPSVEVINQPVPGIDKVLGVLADTIENSIFPLVRSMEKKLDIDLRTLDKMRDLSEQIKALEKDVSVEKVTKNK